MERLNGLAQNPRDTQRFAHHVGTLCRDMSNKAVAQRLHLPEHTVKDRDRRYMPAWLAKTPQLVPQVIGVDERSIKKGHTYRIVVSDLERGRPIWVGGNRSDRSRSGSLFCRAGPEENGPDSVGGHGQVGQAFRNSVQAHAPQAQALFDKFHILRHLAEAMDQVRRAESKRGGQMPRVDSAHQREIR